MSSASTRPSSFFWTNEVANRVLVPALRSPLGRILGRRLAVVEYDGRRTGRRHVLVTQYALHGSTLRIHVGAADHKTWWRNFLQPAPLHVRLAGVDHDATANVVRQSQGVLVEASLEDQPRDRGQERPPSRG